MSFNALFFVKEIAKDICREYEFSFDLETHQNFIEVMLMSERTDIEYVYSVNIDDVNPSSDFYVKIKRDLLLGLHHYILNYFKR